MLVVVGGIGLMSEGLAQTGRWSIVAGSGPGPSARRGVAGVHDAEGGRLIFQGGETAGAAFLGDVWTVDLTTGAFSEDTTATTPRRCHHTLVPDPDRGRALLFGGFPRTDALWSRSDTDGTWREITPASSPAPRCLHSALLCPEREEMIVYGGLNGGSAPDLDDTWSYSLTSGEWTLLGDGSAPGKRYGHVVGLDSARDRMILFGGFHEASTASRQNVGDLWAFDLETREWDELEPGGDGPVARQFAAGGTVADGSGMIIMGGLSDTSYWNDVWFLRFADLRWIPLQPETFTPKPRYRHTVIVDAASNRFWMAFGQCADDEHFTEVWQFDFSLPSSDPMFGRGDADASGDVNLTDGIVVLNHLFQGSAALACEDAGDTNDDSQLDISDATFLFEHLFLGGAAPPAPFGECAADPTDDPLPCDAFEGCR